MYANFIKERKANVECWIPKYSAKNIYVELSKTNTVRKILKSPQYSAVNFLQSPLDFILSKVLSNQFKIKKLNYLILKFRRLLINYYINGTIKRIKYEQLSHRLYLVFPTFDQLALEILKKITQLNLDIQIRLRRMGTESTSPLSKGNEFEQLLDLLNREENQNIKVGIPTPELLIMCQNESFFPERLVWSPLPPKEISTQTKKIVKKQISVGFPGTAKISKGFLEIPKIILSFKDAKINAKFFLQQANFLFDGYLDCLNKLKTSDQDIQILDSVLTIEEYERYLKNLDVIYLPYREEYYRDADSGILYEAADRFIPVICFARLGFSKEAFDFGIGFDPDKYQSLKEVIDVALSSSTVDNISIYNKKRIEEIENFLDLSKV